jgi:hypothetical protein
MRCYRAPDRTAVAAALALVAVLTCIAPPAGAADVRCPAAAITVLNITAPDAEIVCRAAQVAADFLTARGFVVKDAATISIVDRLTAIDLPSIIGTYAAKTHHAEVLRYEAAAKQLPERPAFGVPMSPDLYRSFIVHEIAHAIADPNFVRRPLAPAHEYIAYTTQLATMPDELRNAILRNVDTDGYEHLKEVGDMLLMMDPNRFAVKSYLHFIEPQNGAAAFEQLLTGRF